MALDYEKIWGSNAATQYTFSDIDYLKGWEFIGATPPARQQFDAWMRNADKKMLETHNDIVKAGNNLAAHNTDATAHKPILDAIKAITGLDFGTAPSNTITNMIALLGQGGIVAARLSETGFVKFANGFTIQWGYVRNVENHHKVQLPIAVSSLYAVAGNDENAENEPLVLTFDEYGTTGFRIHSYRVNKVISNIWGSWVAIGKV